jgi:hypothetical protein
MAVVRAASPPEAAKFAIPPPAHPTYDLLHVIRSALAEDAGDQGAYLALSNSPLINSCMIDRKFNMSRNLTFLNRCEHHGRLNNFSLFEIFEQMVTAIQRVELVWISRQEHTHNILIQYL